MSRGGVTRRGRGMRKGEGRWDRSWSEYVAEGRRGCCGVKGKDWENVKGVNMENRV